MSNFCLFVCFPPVASWAGGRGHLWLLDCPAAGAPRGLRPPPGEGAGILGIHKPHGPQFPLPHSRGSSHGQSRGIRRAYTDPYFTGLMEEAYMEWEALEQETATSLIQ